MKMSKNTFQLANQMLGRSQNSKLFALQMRLEIASFTFIPQKYRSDGMYLALDAIIVGVDAQDRYLQKKASWTRKLVVITDGDNPIEVGDWELTARKMNSLHVNTTILFVFFV